MVFFRTFDGNKGFLMKIFRLMEYLHKKRIPIAPGFLMRYIRVIYSCELPATLRLGKGIHFEHSGLGVVIHPDAIIGENTTILQNVTIGGRNSKHAPVLGKMSI